MDDGQSLNVCKCFIEYGIRKLAEQIKEIFVLRKKNMSTGKVTIPLY